MFDGVTYTQAELLLTTLLMTQPRILTMFIMLPMFNHQVVPGMLRYAIAAGIGLVLVPMLAPEYGKLDLPLLTMVLIVVKEVFIGLVLGLLTAIPFWIFEAVGFIIDNQRGASMGS